MSYSGSKCFILISNTDILQMEKLAHYDWKSSKVDGLPISGSDTFLYALFQGYTFY